MCSGQDGHLHGGDAPDGCLVCELEGLGKAVRAAVGRFWEGVPYLLQLPILQLGP
jgi:hypothetical protein